MSVFTYCIEHKERIDLPSDSKLRVGVKHRPLQCERKSSSGDLISIHYDAELYKNGKEIDSSREREQVFRFTLGSKTVISGLDKGLLNMCISERRKLTIPSDLAYGSVGAGHSIPPSATLVYDVELIGIE